MQSLCVYCGSRNGSDPVFADAAGAVGADIARRGWTLVYGGGSVGLMRVVADAMLAAGGRAVGVIPHLLMEREVGHRALSALHVVDNMHQRKQKMADLADGFVALPGGIGTLEELFEVWTWAQLGYHRKPVGLLNTAGYYDPLLAFLDHMQRQEFVAPATRNLLLVDSDPVALLDRMAACAADADPRWAAMRAQV